MKTHSVIVGLCGSSGSGKTLTCTQLIRVLKSEGITCGGFTSPGVFEGTKKSGIMVQWLESGQERVLMTPVTETSQSTFGRWQVYPETFEWINQNLVHLCDCRAFFCDEIGPMEVLEGKGWVAALNIVDERKFDLNVITFRPSLQDYFRQRYPEMSICDLDQKGSSENALRDVKNLFGIG